MKNTLTFGLVLCLISGACFAQDPRIETLIAEKQEKMKRLENCQSTTKGLKIATISTLGVSAVGVIANVAEAKILNEAKADVEDAKKQKAKKEKKKKSSGTQETKEGTNKTDLKTDAFAAADFENLCIKNGGKNRQRSETSAFICDFDATLTDLDQALKTAREFWGKMGCDITFDPINVFEKQLDMLCHSVWSKEKEFSGFVYVNFDKAVCQISGQRYHHKAQQCECLDAYELNEAKTECVQKKQS
jgi:hypothetical protein